MCEAVTYWEVAKVKDATGEFTLTGWDENTYTEREPGKLTKASVTQDFSGDIEGTGRSEWLMCYREDGTADFVGIQEVEGKIHDLEGGFVATTVGTFDGERAEGRWDVVAGSGMGELVGIVGSGQYSAPHGPKASFQLSYEIG
jgi:hypothetical protein